jgi:hypothetical protein
MKKFDPLDQFLKDKIANPDSFEPVDFSEFEAFKKNAPDPLDRWIQSGLKNHESAVEESDWLAFQDRLKSVEEENNKVLGWFKKMLKHPPLEQVSFHEFQAFQRGYLFKKWALIIYADVQNVTNAQSRQQDYLSVKTDANGNPILDANKPGYYLPKYIMNSNGVRTPNIGVIIEL